MRKNSLKRIPTQLYEYIYEHFCKLHREAVTSILKTMEPVASTHKTTEPVTSTRKTTEPVTSTLKTMQRNKSYPSSPSGR